jgi:hypothetical protein
MVLTGASRAICDIQVRHAVANIDAVPSAGEPW